MSTSWSFTVDTLERCYGCRRISVNDDDVRVYILQYTAKCRRNVLLLLLLNRWLCNQMVRGPSLMTSSLKLVLRFSRTWSSTSRVRRSIYSLPTRWDQKPADSRYSLSVVVVVVDYVSTTAMQDINSWVHPSVCPSVFCLHLQLWRHLMNAVKMYYHPMQQPSFVAIFTCRRVMLSSASHYFTLIFIYNQLYSPTHAVDTQRTTRKK